MTNEKPNYLNELLPELLTNHGDTKLLKKKIHKLVKEAGGVKNFIHPDEILRSLTKTVYEALLDEELDDHLGYEKNGTSPSGNYRNGSSSKTVKSTTGPIEMDIPRDRNGSFDPILVKKHQRNLGKIEDLIISLYSRGLSTREIEAHIKEIYDVQISPTLVSRITDRIIEERKAWQSRPLEAVYPILYLDGIRYSVNQDSRVISKVVYVAIGVSMTGKQDVLGLWMAENEGAQFWLSVCNDLKARGVKDILIACVDGLKGLPEAIQATFNQADVQLCVVHMIRAATRFISYKDRKAFCADLKSIYNAPTVEAAEMARDALVEKWGSKYPGSVKVWLDNWTRITTFFNYPVEIRKFIYTTNQIENLNSVLRKNSSTKKVFPSDEALLKLLYVNTLEQIKKWTSRRGWDIIINQLFILFPERLAAVKLEGF
jgi:transposase-like protein